MKYSNANDFTDSAKAYLSELTDKKYNPIPKEIEDDLIKKMQNGDKRAYQQLIEAHLRLVINIAKGYKGRGVNMPELISEGNMGLITALDRFDPTKGVRLCAYSTWWITKFIIESINNNSINTEISIFDNNSENTNAFDIAQDTVEEIDKEYFQTAIEILVAELDERSKFIIEHYYGINAKKQLTTYEISKELNISMERVRQLRARILSDLRSQALSHNFKNTYQEE